MQFFIHLSNFIVPFIILAIVTYGILMKTNVYDNFIIGTKQGMKTVVQILPTLIGLMTAVGILRASGFLDFCAELIGRYTERIHFPGALVPLTLVKMFSSSAATGLLLDLYKEYGTDSIEIHKDAIEEGDVVLIHDDLLATGGTMLAAYNLVKKMNPSKVMINFIIELEDLKGREIFPKETKIDSLLFLEGE